MIAKRRKILNSEVNLVEIDLLRSGESKQVAGGGEIGLSYFS